MVNAVVNYGGVISFFFCFFILGFALLGWALERKEGGGGGLLTGSIVDGLFLADCWLVTGT